MAQNNTPITMIGNLVGDPELRFTPSGAAVANFRMASTPRTFNKQTNQYEDGEALFLTVNVWRKMAENVAETFTKGMRVIVQGNLKQRSYQNKEGENRTVYEIEADEVGPSLRFSTAQMTRNPQENQAQGGQQQQPQGQQQSQGGFQNQQNDPWNSAPPSQPQGGFQNQNQGGYNPQNGAAHQGGFSG